MATIGIGATQVIGTDKLSIKIGVNAEDEYITLKNTGDSKEDLSNYRIDLEYSDQTTQDQPFEDNTVIPAGDSIHVGTGSKTEGDVDQDLGYDKAMLNNENPDVVALLNTDGDVVAKSNDSPTDKTTTTEEEDTTDDSSDETTTEEETTTEDDSDESTSDETTDDSDDSESSASSSDDTQSDNDNEPDKSESSGSDGSEDSDDSSAENDSQDDC